MFPELREKQQKRANLVAQSRDILNKAEQEKRALTAEEEQQYDAIDKDIEKLTNEIDQITRTLERRDRQSRHEGAVGGETPPAAGGREEPGGQQRNSGPRATEEYRSAFSRFLRSGANALSAEEFRAMQADNDTGGGFLVAPQQMVMELLKAVDDAVIIRQLSRTFQLTQAESLGVPTLNKANVDAEWTAELKTGGQMEVSFGKRELRPHPLSKMALVSNRLLRVAAMNPEGIVRGELARIFGETMEKAYMTGDGNQKPLGLFVATADGISTDRDVSTENEATKVTGDGLINAKYALKQAYWKRAQWIFHRDVVKQIRKLKNAVNGEYIWQPGITNGTPDRILELPYRLSEFAPNTMTTGKYVGILGDFSYYWIADALDMQIQRLVELYALSNQTAFIGRLESDAMPVLEEAFVRVKLG